MQNVSKAFPGVEALKRVNFELRIGEVHGLVGENGAGKSTLMKILMGVYNKDKGNILINNKTVEIQTPTEAHQHGVGMIFQELSLIPQLTVAENIFLNIEPVKKLPLFVDDSLLYDRAQKFIDSFGINLDPHSKISDLNRAYSQITEILKVLVRDAQLIIMDEPTASLTKSEEDMLYDAINKLKANGVSIIYISHRLKEIFNICDRVTILRDGAKIDTKDIKDINMVKLVEMMTGKTSSTMYNRRQNMILSKQKNKKHLLEVKNISQTPVLKGVSFNLAVGEILGIVGLLGSGKTEIAKALFGIDPIEGGEIRILGKSVQINNPQDAIKCGINLVPEDRRIEGLILSQSVEANLTLPSLNILSKAGFISRNKSRTIATNHVKRLQIKTPGILQTTEFLSGGNQQKVVLGKWLTKSPQILLLDEPTVGIDVNAKAEVRKIISDHVNSNSCSVILFSSDLDEVIRIADRIIVMYQGKVFEEISNNPPIEEQVLHHTVQGAMEDVH